MPPSDPPPRPKPSRKGRGYWLRTMIQWHWVSSAICLVGMILFSVTGITLNHAGQIESAPLIENKTFQVPSELLATTRDITEKSKPLPVEVAKWISRQIERAVSLRPAEWSESEIYLSMPGPGVDAWIAIDRSTGEGEFESTDRGWIAYFNDLHKGRNTGVVWMWFIDLFAIGSLIFCLTGVYLLYFHARHRRMTWPVVALGFLIPAAIALLIQHFP